MNPLDPIGWPEEVVELIYFLASPTAGWIYGCVVLDCRRLGADWAR